VFGHEDDVDLDERLILWLSRARTEFPGSVIRESEEVKEKASKSEKILLTFLRHNSSPKSGELETFLKGEPNIPKFQNSKIPPRTNFRDWYTLTIDGSDAKDLYDAISIRKEPSGDYTLAVHIADVAEYVTEGSSLDREALTRATSIYTPGKVIPMLPEILSNDLCSLHPGTMKLTLSAVMTIDPRGYVKHTDIVEGIIESQHRGVYDDIYQRMGTKSTEVTASEELQKSIQLAKSLYHILEKRRRKEGKITFESTEIYFDFSTPLSDGGSRGEPVSQKTPVNIKRRERNDAHKLIEEFMVLANEEVAKWCKKHDLPFLSRVHGLPGNEQTEIINTILAQTQKNPHLIKLPTAK
jgi:ribonuclease R